MSNNVRVWIYWAFALVLTLGGISVIDAEPRDSFEEFVGYLAVGFGLLAMLQAGKAMR